MELHGRTIKAGSKVWGLATGWLTVHSVRWSSDYPIAADDSTGKRFTFDSNGLRYTSDNYPTLLWNEVAINPEEIAPPKAKRKLYLFAFRCASGVWKQTTVYYEKLSDIGESGVIGTFTRLDNTMIEVD